MYLKICCSDLFALFLTSREESFHLRRRLQIFTKARLDKPCQEIPPGRELAEEPLQSTQWTSRQMVHLTQHQWPRHQEAPERIH